MKMRHLTLAEVVVVAAVVFVALLLLVPTRSNAGRYGMEVACQANVQRLLRAWNMYHEDNDGWLVGGSNYYSGSRRTPYRWVEAPLFDPAHNPGAPPEGYNSPVVQQLQLTHEYRLNGIRAGKLFPYTDNVTLYHCPADRNWKTNTPDYAAYRSYAVPGLMNSEDFMMRNGWPGYVGPAGWRTIMMPDGKAKSLKLAQKFHEITSPERKYVFVEEDAAGHQQAYSYGGFILMGSGYWYWWDWPALFHGERSVLGFADGHVASRRWMDRRTIMLSGGSILLHQPDNPDLEYMNRGYMACD
jgi:prepilin-type processing-associated H-X9-DG protein